MRAFRVVNDPETGFKKIRVGLGKPFDWYGNVLKTYLARRKVACPVIQPSDADDGGFTVLAWSGPWRTTPPPPPPRRLRRSTASRAWPARGRPEYSAHLAHLPVIAVRNAVSAAAAGFPRILSNLSETKTSSKQAALGVRLEPPTGGGG